MARFICFPDDKEEAYKKICYNLKNIRRVAHFPGKIQIEFEDGDHLDFPLSDKDADKIMRMIEGASHE